MDDKSLLADDEPTGNTAHSPAVFSPHSVHMLRTVQNNTLKLSQMADQKASILMGATFLVFSIAVSRSLTGDLPWSLAILAIFAFLSSLLAVLAVLPSVRQPDAPSKVNPLFFGHFSAMEEEDWAAQILTTLAQDEAVFRAMLHDIYQNGMVLQRRKYRYLGYAYRVFIVGLVVTLATFTVEFGGSL